MGLGKRSLVIKYVETALEEQVFPEQLGDKGEINGLLKCQRSSRQYELWMVIEYLGTFCGICQNPLVLQKPDLTGGFWPSVSSFG